jgi:hypothetical protein
MNRQRLGVLSLLLAPLLWLWPSVFGGRTFVPYDTAQFPPASLTLSPAQLDAARDGANFDVTEVPPWFLPELVLARDELRQGRLPTWNPHARGGAPLHAHGLIGLCYPPNWLALFADDPAARLVYVTWLNLALGGLLAFGLFRCAGLSLLPAWFGALLFELSAPMATNAFFWMRLGSFVWLPGVLWAVLALAQSKSVQPRHAGALGGAFALSWLAGFPPFAATTSLLGVGLAAWLVLGRLCRHGHRPARTLALQLGAGFVLGGCLALPQVLPSLQFFPHSARETKPDFQRIADQAFDSYGLLGFVLPDALGHPSDTTAVPYGGQNPYGLLLNGRTRDGKPTEPNYNYTEYAVFVGQLGLLLAIVGALLGRGHQRGFALVAWLGCAGLALFWPGVRLLFLLPLVENVWPLRWLAPATLCVAWLAAIGLGRVLQGGARLPLTIALAALALTLPRWLLTAPSAWTEADSRQFATALGDKFGIDAAGAANHVQAGSPGIDRFAAAHARLYGEASRMLPWLLGIAAWAGLVAAWRDERRRRWLALAAGVGSALQLGAHGSTVTRGARLEVPFATPVHAFLRERAAALATTGGFTIARGSRGQALPAQLPPGQLMVRGLRDLHFYSHFDGRSLQPLQALLGRQLGERFAGKGYLTSALPDELPPPQPGENVTAHPFAHPLFDLLGVRYVLATEPLAHAGQVVAVPGAPAGFFVHERSTALPRSFAVDEVVAHASDQAVVQALLAPTFVPQRSAHVLAAEAPPSPAARRPTFDAPRRAVQFVRDEPTTLELDVAAGASAWLVLTDTFLPGWTATVDGRDVALHRANHAFRLVAVPPTRCRVVFTYRAPGLAVGCLVAGLATLATGVWWIAARRRGKALAKLA